MIAAFIERRLQSFRYRFPHAGHGQQEQGFLYGLPIFFGDQDGIVALSRDQ